MPSLISRFNPETGPIVSIGITPDSTESAAPLLCDALLDTGSDCTCLSSAIIKQLNLPVAGKRLLMSANHMSVCLIYAVNVHIPFHEGYFIQPGIEVAEFLAPNHFQILLDRDIISKGHLSIAPDGHMTFSL